MLTKDEDWNSHCPSTERAKRNLVDAPGYYSQLTIRSARVCVIQAPLPIKRIIGG